ncbi:bifunctional DNA primase/polymerase [Streptomyces sp. MUM 203J]|uniref:bifunctional DNA primase/polymerase n=1 Tax=Streptomyces sp. MUM 203J TaxID=2791990 RepID=UPI001F033B10|nr:bifunctional DNA primase/polymerase [Streptomyces sp. MUM 203J]MCH0538850.1 bifunctional DNA primase/polymerase [Streptomyces sp. MUM 203J]
MREILGRRRRLPFGRKKGPDHLDAALLCATRWHWPVLPGVGLKAAKATKKAKEAGQARETKAAAVKWVRAAASANTRWEEAPVCACPDPECVVPGAHPFDPGILAATTDPRMVRWWWTERPDAPVVLATGGRAPCAVSLPALAGARALAVLDRRGLRSGPVVATPTRWSLLVAPYSLERLGELLYAQDRVPSSLRFHGEGGYLMLPPSRTGAGWVRWERPPPAKDCAPWLPEVESVVDALVAASAGIPDSGTRLRY